MARLQNLFGSSQIAFEKCSYQSQVRRLRALVEEGVALYPIRTKSIEFINHGENATFRVIVTDGSKYLFRVHRSNYHSKKALLEELSWLKHMSRDKGVIQKPIQSRNGEWLVNVKHPGVGDRYCDMLSWVEGRFLSKSISEADMFKIGVLLGQIQEAGRLMPSTKRLYWNSEGLVGARPKFGPIDRLEVLKLSDRQKLARHRKEIFRRLKRYEKDHSKKMGLIHADLHFGNLLKQSSGEIAAIDFDDCGYGFYLYDLAIPLVGVEYHLRLHKKFRAYSMLKAALIAGYSSRVTVTEEDRRVLQDLIVARKMLMIGWLHSRSDNPRFKNLLATYAKKTLRYIDKPYL